MNASAFCKICVRGLEELEPRLVMTGNPVADFQADFVLEEQIIDDLEAMLQTAHQQTGLDVAVEQYGFTGQGQTVVVIDTGIAYDHAALGGGLGADYQVVGGWDFTEGDADPYDDGPYGAHGTHVAGIIGSNDPIHRGVAPGVDLVGLRVFDDSGLGTFGWVEQALQWVHDHRNDFENPITTVSISIGTNWNSDHAPGWAMLEDEFARLEADGIFIAVAAGNSFASYQSTGLSYPAVSQYVVPVASLDDDGTLSDFSQRNDRVIAAPGQSITSTVPDYVGNYNGRTDDWASFSGTSMATPYVAGASALLREAYGFVGMTNVTQDDIFQLMVDSSDSIYDPLTGATYHSLNVGRALDLIMPEDDYGSTAASAFQLDHLADGQTILGTFAQLNDADYFTFTATQSGQLTLAASTESGSAIHWRNDGLAVLDAGGESLSFQITAGQSYGFSVSAAGQLDHYQIDVAFEAEAPQREIPTTDWGVVTNQVDIHQGLEFGTQRFALSAARTGLLTIQADIDPTQGNVEVRLYNDRGELVSSGPAQADPSRVEVSAQAGQTYYLETTGLNRDVTFRLTNLIGVDGQQVTVHGTDQADTFEFSAGAVHQITVNGVQYDFDAADLSSIEIVADSDDNVLLQGTSGAESFTFQNGTARFTGQGFQTTVSNVAAITVRGQGGQDTATLYGTVGDETLDAGPDQATFASDGFHVRAEGFEQLTVLGQGGHDAAVLHDSAGRETLTATPQRVTMVGSTFRIEVNNFDNVLAHGHGEDAAYLYDSSGNDLLHSTPEGATLSGTGFHNAVQGFGVTIAYATAGFDRATLFDSQGNDVFNARAGQVQFTGQGFDVRAIRFDEVVAHSSGGKDQATFADTALDDHFMADSMRAQFENQDAVYVAFGFSRVTASAGQGHDTAMLYGRPLQDRLEFVNGGLRMSGPLGENSAAGFDQLRIGLWNMPDFISRSAETTLAATTSTQNWALPNAPAVSTPDSLGTMLDSGAVRRHDEILDATRDEELARMKLAGSAVGQALRHSGQLSGMLARSFQALGQGTAPTTVFHTNSSESADSGLNPTTAFTGGSSLRRIPSNEVNSMTPRQGTTASGSGLSDERAGENHADSDGGSAHDTTTLDRDLTHDVLDSLFDVDLGPGNNLLRQLDAMLGTNSLGLKRPVEGDPAQLTDHLFHDIGVWR